MRILIVDDDRTNVRLLQVLLSKDGHETHHAENGAIGLEMFSSIDPDLVLMDVMMPVMDGLEAGRKIKEMCGDKFVPMLYLTAMSDEEALGQCVDAGGDDFLAKPYNRAVLGAKLKSLDRIRRLNDQVYWQRQELTRHQSHMESDMRVAQGIMEKITRVATSSIPCVRTHISSMEEFCGDLVMTVRTMSGGCMVLVGDFTGHGLPAAVCAVPVARTFSTMSTKGFSVGDIAQEMNEQLTSFLSTGLFCAACIMEVDANQTSLTVWNGGLPEVLILNGRREVVRRIPSTHLALGMIPADPEYKRVEIVDLDPDMLIVAGSDGVIEAQNAAGEMFGTARLLTALSNPGGDAIADIMELVEIHVDGVPVDDDVTIVTIDCSQPLSEDGDESSGETARTEVATDWSISWSLGADTLRTVDPLPILMNAWKDFPSPPEHREAVFTVLAELFANALDHGVLGLDSALKETTDGFLTYYREKETRLAALKEGRINVELGHDPGPTGGTVRIVVEDSGPGFDVSAVTHGLQSNAKHSGRGRSLVIELCESLDYNESGNRAEAVYQWEMATA